MATADTVQADTPSNGHGGGLRRQAVWAGALTAIILGAWLIARPSHGSSADICYGNSAHGAGEMDELDVLAATWILACNDDHPVITYEGIRYRLGLPADFDVKRLVRSRGELFRPGATHAELEEWRAEMLSGKALPSWVRAVGDKHEREQVIRALSRQDVFRSQFRAEPHAPRASLEVTNWGLERIERLRRSRAELREATERRWQIWSVLGIGVANIVTTLATAMYKAKS